MKRILPFLLVLGILFPIHSAIAVTEAKWSSPEVALGAPKAKVLEILGKPDSVDSGTEMYMVSDSKEIMMTMVEYKDDKVSVMGQIYKPTIALRDLEERLKTQGLTPFSKNEEAVVYFTKMPDSDLEYYITLNPSTEDTTGPGMAKMTKEAFKDAENSEMGEGNASEGSPIQMKKEEKPSEPKSEKAAEPKTETATPVASEPKKEEKK